MADAEEVSVRSLEQMMGANGLSEHFRSVARLVEYALFSQYLQRRATAQRLLYFLWTLPVEVSKMRDDEFINTYLRFGGMGSYYFVKRYPMRPYLESVPNREEIESWTRFA